jgi:large subunit ribosomal protein L24
MTQPKFKVKRGDTVQVTTGSHKGKQGIVQKVLLDEGKVIVEGVNIVTRHMRPSAVNPEGRIEKTKPIQISNVAVVDPSTNEPSKVGYRMEDGKKVRYYKKSGNVV